MSVINRCNTLDKQIFWIAVTISVCWESYYRFLGQTRTLELGYPRGLAFWPKLMFFVSDPNNVAAILGASVGTLVAGCILIALPVYALLKAFGVSVPRARLCGSVAILLVVLLRVLG